METISVVFMGTPDFAVPCLEMLCEQNYQIKAVITQPDRPKGRGQKLVESPVKACALKHGLPILQPQKIKTPEFEAILEELNPDLIVVVAFGQILSKRILDIPRLGCINVHASLLPKYRGAAPLHWSVIRGEKKTGVTTMFMDEGLDTGDMLLTAEMDITDTTTTGEVHDTLQNMGADVLSETIKQLVAGTAVRRVQNHEEATYAPLLTKELECIDWTQSAANIHNLIRGLNPWPGSYTICRNKRLKLWGSEVLAEETDKQAGTIIRVENERLVVAAGTGVIALTSVQPEGKKRMAAGDFARGYQITVGEILG